VSAKKGLVLAIVVAYLLSLVTMIVIAPYILSLFPVKTGQIANGAVTTDKIAEGSVANLKLADYAIPFNSTSSITAISKTTSTYEDIEGMSVDITLERTSHLIIMFSAKAAISDATKSILWQALIYDGSTEYIALSRAVYLQPNLNYYTSISYNW